MLSMLSTLASTSVPAALLADGSAAGGSFLGNPMFMMILMIGVIYFIVLRPMSKQEKDRKKRVETIKKGDQVVLQGGILGRVTNVDDPKILVIELADRVRVRVLRSKVDDLQDFILKAEAAGSSKKDDAKAEAKKDDAKAEAKTDTKVEAKTEAKVEAKPDKKAKKDEPKKDEAAAEAEGSNDA
jgi:preprotein translocase subunit YajC